MLHFVEGNAEQLPLASASQDSYSIAFGIRNVTHIDRALQDSYRVRCCCCCTDSTGRQPLSSDWRWAEQVLRRGGHFLCLEFCPQAIQGLQTAYDWYSMNVMTKVCPRIVQVHGKQAAS